MKPTTEDVKSTVDSGYRQIRRISRKAKYNKKSGGTIDKTPIVSKTKKKRGRDEENSEEEFIDLDLEEQLSNKRRRLDLERPPSSIIGSASSGTGILFSEDEEQVSYQ